MSLLSHSLPHARTTQTRRSRHLGPSWGMLREGLPPAQHSRTPCGAGLSLGLSLWSVLLPALLPLAPISQLWPECRAPLPHLSQGKIQYCQSWDFLEVTLQSYPVEIECEPREPFKILQEPHKDVKETSEINFTNTFCLSQHICCIGDPSAWRVYGTY